MTRAFHALLCFAAMTARGAHARALREPIDAISFADFLEEQVNYFNEISHDSNESLQIQINVRHSVESQSYPLHATETHEIVSEYTTAIEASDAPSSNDYDDYYDYYNLNSH